MSSHQRSNGRRLEQRHIPGQNQYVVKIRVGTVVVGETSQPDAGGISRSVLRVLLHEREVKVWFLGLECFGDPLGAVTHHHNHSLDRAISQRIKHVLQHGPTGEEMQRLGS